MLALVWDKGNLGHLQIVKIEKLSLFWIVLSGCAVIFIIV